MLSHIECLFLFFCYRLGDHRDLHVLTHAFPTRRSSDLEKLELYSQQGIGGIIRINTDGTGREVYTYGIRNSVGHDFNPANGDLWFTDNRSEEHTSELQSLMRISYAVFCLKKKHTLITHPSYTSFYTNRHHFI